MCGVTPSGWIPTKLGTCVRLTDVIKHTKFHRYNLRGFGAVRCWSFHVAIGTKAVLNTLLSATALQVMTGSTFKPHQPGDSSLRGRPCWHQTTLKSHASTTNADRRIDYQSIISPNLEINDILSPRFVAMPVSSGWSCSNTYFSGI